MSINCRVLGTAGRDNALLVHINSGQSVTRLLLDCGDGCLSEMSFADIQSIDHLCFSHLHIDHVAGFDQYFRCNFSRDAKPNRIWGPPGTTKILQHRFQGFLWNLHEEMDGTWLVTDIHSDSLHTNRFELREAFSIAHDVDCQMFERTLVEGAGFVVEAMTMDHRTPTIAYIIRESVKQNIDMSRLATLGLTPGPWLRQLKETSDRTANVMIDGVSWSMSELRTKLIVETPGDSVAYLTDFLLDEPAIERLAVALRGCRTIVCEGQYRHADVALAKKNYHMTTVLAANLAQQAQVDELILFHLSDRYERTEWETMLMEAREIFPNATYPPQWNMSPQTPVTDCR